MNENECTSQQAAEATDRIGALFVEWAALDRIWTDADFHDCTKGTITQRARAAGLEAEISALLFALSFTTHPAPMSVNWWRMEARASNYATPTT
jgi:hypothetical protein